MDSSCFVVAVANCLIYLKLPVGNIEIAKDVACCRSGSTIHHKKVVEFLKAPLKPIDDPNAVFQNGGVLNIMHPIFNGHCFFLFPQNGKLITMINSWLGPNVAANIAYKEILPFASQQLGKHWAI